MRFNYTFEKKQMLCTLWAVLASLLLPLGAWAQTEPSKDSEGYYLISNAAELIWFRGQVNNGNTTINGKLTADIDLSNEQNYIPIGNTESTAYAGKFNGQFHRIMNMNIDSKNNNSVGFFGYASTNSRIERVIIDSSCKIKSTSSANYVGGVLGQHPRNGETDTLYLSYCGNEASIEAGGNVGGVMGGNRAYNPVKIKYCYNTGNLNATNGDAGTVIGYIGNNSTFLIQDCWNSGNVKATGKKQYVLNYQGTVKVSNSYGLAGTPLNGGNENASSFTPDELVNGALASKLNSNTTDGTQVWFQKIGVDTHPVFINTGDNTVYKIGNKACNGQTIGYSYANNADQSVTQAHSYGDDGSCAVCHAQAPLTQNGGYYQISGVEDLFWFRDQVNSGNHTIKGELTHDIDFTGIEVANGKNFTPIGNTVANAYAGHFKGLFHRIKNMHLYGADGIGFIGYAGNNCTIEGIIIDKSCSVTSVASWVGGVVGQCSDATYTITINNCGNEARIQGKENVGGVFGGIRGTVSGKSTVNISNCYNTGSITATGDDGNTIAGYVGNGNAYLTNCWNKGSGKYFTRTTNSVKLTNCYSLNGTPIKVNGSNSAAESFTAEELANGALTYKLNGDKSDGKLVWYQKIGVDEHPVFAKGNTVYCINDLACDGHTSQGSHYSNDANDPRKVADHDEAQKWDGAHYNYDIVCQNCHETLGKCFHYDDSENTVTVTKNQEGAWYADSEIDLSDSYDYTSPVDFIARSVTYTRKMSDNYGSLILPFEAKSDNKVTLYSLAEVNNDNVTFQKAETIAAGTPCIFLATKGEDVVITGENVTLSAMAQPQVDGEPGDMQMHGTYQKKTGQTNLWFLAKDKLYYSSTAPVTLLPFRSWLTSTTTGASSMRNIIIEDEGMTTAIECINNQAESTASCTYDLHGRLVKNQKSGFMIQNGKKVLVGSK